MEAESNDVALTLRVPTELKQRVEALAISQDRSNSWVVRMILEHHFRRLEIERAVNADVAAKQAA